MTNEREKAIETITQMLAPKLFVLSGDKPEEMGFPFADSEEDLKEKLLRQLDPVAFWTAKAREIAEAIVDVFRVDFVVTDEMVARAAKYAEKWQKEQSND